jgi:hypothetical protein
LPTNNFNLTASDISINIYEALPKTGYEEIAQLSLGKVLCRRRDMNTLEKQKAGKIIAALVKAP